MKPVFRKLTALVVIFSMAFSSIGCTTMKPILLIKPGDVTKQIKAGDTIQYRTAFGKTEELKVTAVSSEVISGTNSGQARQVRIADVESISKKQISAGKTSLLVLVALVLAAFIVSTTRDKNAPFNGLWS